MEEMKAKAIEEIKRTINQSKSAINEQTRENYYQIAQAKIHIVYKIGLLLLPQKTAIQLE